MQPWLTDTECWNCQRPGQYTGKYALCHHCDTPRNRARFAALAAEVERKRYEWEGSPDNHTGEA